VTGLHGDQTKATAQQPPPQGDFARSYGRMAVRTDFLSAHGQSIVPARSQTDVRHSAPSPQNFTGKPSLTYAVGPFVVELFTAAGFAGGRRGGRPRFCLSPGRSSPRQPR